MSPIARRWASLLVLLRVVALAVGVQLSGLAPALEELVCAAKEAVEQGAACPCNEPCSSDELHSSDEPCIDCPQGCPKCHCPNGLRSVAPEPFAALAPAFPALALGLLDEASQAPPGPDLPSLFRPPRTYPAV
jgi:hypothetical protein